MAKGISIHVGLNRVDPAWYGSCRQLEGCEQDAKDMAEIARSQGFRRIPPLLNENATVRAVKRQVRSAARRLRAGDVLLLTCSAHGTRFPDLNRDDRDGRGNLDHQDEAWCLYDRPVVDDELYALWARFAPGVRIFVISDTCYSAGVLWMASTEEDGEPACGPSEPAVRALPAAQAKLLYTRSKGLYGRIQDRYTRVRLAPICASVLLLSACGELERAYDGRPNGHFTAALLEVWSGGAFQGDHLDLRCRIHEKTSPKQRPDYRTLGVPDPCFERMRPFTI